MIQKVVIFIDTNDTWGRVETEADWGQIVQNVCRIRGWSQSKAEEYLLSCKMTQLAANNPDLAYYFGDYAEHTGKTLREYLGEDKQ